MWYKLNEAIGIVLLIAVVGGGAIYGLVKFMSGPPLLRQEGDEIDPRQNAYMRGIMEDHDRRMRDIQERASRSIEESIEVGRQATAS